MYIVRVLKKNDSPSLSRNVSGLPVIFTGSGEDYKTLKEGIAAAHRWISSSNDPESYEVNYRVVGCL